MNSLPIDYTVRFTVPGAPVPKGRPKIARRGAFVHAYTPEKTVNYEGLVAHEAGLAFKRHAVSVDNFGADPTGATDSAPAFNAALDTLSGTPTERPIYLEIHLTVPIPASWSKKKQAACVDGIVVPTKKPDTDNVLKAISDALNGIAFRDDSQVVDTTISKRYGLNPCAVVSVHVLNLTSA